MNSEKNTWSFILLEEGSGKNAWEGEANASGRRSMLRRGIKYGANALGLNPGGNSPALPRDVCYVCHIENRHMHDMHNASASDPDCTLTASQAILAGIEEFQPSAADSGFAGQAR